MCKSNSLKRLIAMLLCVLMLVSYMPVSANAATDTTLESALAEAKSYTDALTINNSSNDPATVVKNFKTHFTWDNEKRENSKSYLFDWSYYNGVVFEGLEYLYEVTGETVYKDYVVEYMSSLINSNGDWATCTNSGYTSMQCAGYNSTHGADCYKTASLLLDTYEMTGDSRYLTMAKTLYADLDSAASKYSLSNAGNNYRHTWASDPSPDLWLDGLYMILPFRAEYAKYIGDTEELDLIVSRMQWVSDNMYNSSKGLFYHAADSASSNSGTYWLRSIGWYAAAIVDIMDSMSGSNLEAMKKQLVKLVDGMKACQNTSNGMWLNNMNASMSSSNPYETSGTALTCYAVMKAVNNGWLDESYADMALLAFKGICSEKLNGTTLTDICFKGAPGSSNSTFYDNEGKGAGPFIMFYAEVLEYANKADSEEPAPTESEPEPEETTVPKETEPEESKPEIVGVYTGKGTLQGPGTYTLDTDGLNSGSQYLIVCSGKALMNDNGTDSNPSVTVSNNTITPADDSNLAWTVTASGSGYTFENNGSYINLCDSNDIINSSATLYVTSGSTYKIREGNGSGRYLRYSPTSYWCAGNSDSNNALSLYRCTGHAEGDSVVFTVNTTAETIQPAESLALDCVVTVANSAASDYEIQWASDSNEITVSNGVITAAETAAAGSTAIITATLTEANGSALTNSIVLTIPVTVQGHVYESVTTNATCTENGSIVYTCTLCGDSYSEVIPATGHTYESVTVDATCGVAGSITYTCACGDTYAETIPATGEHAYESVTVDATCIAAGSTTHTCSVCGNVKTDVIPATGKHTYESVTTDPSCSTDGFTTFTCSVCGDSYVEKIPATGEHVYTSVTVDPTCSKDGSITYTCGCGDTYTEAIPATGKHTYESATVDATCVTEGTITYTCSVCGHSYTESIPATGEHTYKTVTQEATCDAAGSVTHTCSVCGDVKTEAIPALGHSYDSTVKQATCVDAGSVTYTCARCGNTYAEEIPATGEHTYESVTVAPQPGKEGSITYTCSVCGHSYSEVLEAEPIVYSASGSIAGDNVYTLDTDGTIETGEENRYLIAGSDDDILLYDNGADNEAGVEEVTIQDDTITLEHQDYDWYIAEDEGDLYITHDGTNELYHYYYEVYTNEDKNQTWTIEAGETEGEYRLIGFENTDWHLYYNGDEKDFRVRQDADSYVRLYQLTSPSFSSDIAFSVSVPVEISLLAGKSCVLNASVLVDNTEASDSQIHWSTSDASVAAVDANGTITAVSEGDVTITAALESVNGYAPADAMVLEIPVSTYEHQYEAVTVEPDCETTGSVTYTCAVCGHTYTDTLAALGHDYKSEVVEATCLEDGSITYTCSRCDDSYTEVIKANGSHSYETVITPATCEKDGSITNTCTACGDTSSESISATGHSYSSVTVDPTCNADGATTYTCGLCGDTYSETIPATGKHSYTSAVKAPTCTEDGCTVYTCGNCGSSYTDSVVPALGHKYDAIVKVPTCEEAGYTNYVCSVCGDSYTADEVAALGHTYEEFVYEPSCTEDGFTDHICVNCGDAYMDNFVPAPGHDYESVEIAPTCTLNGSITYTCSVCGGSYREVISATGHNYTAKEVDGYMVYTCVCGDSYSEKIQTVLTYNKVSSLSSGNAYVLTFTSGSTYYALSHANDKISVVKVTVSNGVIISEITKDLVWNYSGNKLSYVNASGTTMYLYTAKPSGWMNLFGTPTLGISASTSSSVSFSSSKLKVGSYYLRYSGGAISANSRSSTCYAFVETAI